MDWTGGSDDVGLLYLTKNSLANPHTSNPIGAYLVGDYLEVQSMSMDEYYTLKQEASDEYVVKHSRFISYALPVQTQEEAVAFINKIRAIMEEKYPDYTYYITLDYDISD